MPFYVVAKGRETGIFNTWAQCRDLVAGYPYPVYRKFDTIEEAEEFLANRSISYYAVAKGREVGIFDSWAQCADLTDGYEGAKFKKFATKAEAEQYIAGSGNEAFYAVARGREVGIFDSWAVCRKHTVGYPSAKYKKFATKAEAEQYIIEENCAEIAEPDLSAAPHDQLVIYTDGACTRNGKAGAAAGIGVYFGEDDPRNVSKRVEGPKQTNNVAELLAVITAIEIICEDIEKYTKIFIYTDSEYVIKCATTYGKKIDQGKVKDTVPNYDLVVKLYSHIKKINNDGKNIRLVLKYIRGHTEKEDVHSIGNKCADLLATNAI
jgi:ribonuclease HI